MAAVTPVQPLVLAFHLEHTGWEDRCSVLCLGAAVWYQDRIVAQQRWCAYTDDVYFEPSYYRQFWLNKQYLLKAWETSGNQREALKAMIQGFQQFRLEWETEAVERGVPLILVCQDVASSVGWVNALIRQHLPEQRPLPFGVGTREYYRLWDVESLCRGWLVDVDGSTFRYTWGLDRRAEQVLGIKFQDETHFPDADAARMARIVAVVLGLASPKIAAGVPETCHCSCRKT